MGALDDRIGKLIDAEGRLSTLERRLETLPKGGGDDTSGGMEARLTRLERNVDTLTKDAGDIRVDVGTIKENIRHLPTKPWIFSTLLAMLTALTVIVGLIVRFIPHAG